MKKDIRATIAPFYDLPARQYASMPEDKRLSVRETFFRSAAFLAELCGLPFNPDCAVQNVGGFSNEHGENLIEISHTFTFRDADKEKVDLFAALMAEFGYEGQESTISACYCDADDENRTAQERIIHLHSLDSLVQIAQSCGVNNFTINTGDGTLSTLVWNRSENDRLNKLITKLKNHGYYKKDEDRPVISRYLGRPERAELYQGWLQNRTGLSQMVMSEDKNREQHRGIPQMGVQEQRTGAGCVRCRVEEGTWPSAEHHDRRLGLLRRAIGEAYRRLVQKDHPLRETDSFLTNLELEMLRADTTELTAFNTGLAKRVTAAETALAGMTSQMEDYESKFYRTLNTPEALTEYRRQEYEKYKNSVLDRICTNLSKVFPNGPFTGADIVFQYPPYADDKPLGNWTTHGEILSITFINGKGETVRWSQTDGSLDQKGNHVTPQGATFNISTGEYRQAVEKVKQEWKTTELILEPTLKPHR